MPLFNNCTGVRIQDGMFYEVLGDVNLHTHQQLLIGDPRAQITARFQALPGHARGVEVTEAQDGRNEGHRRESSRSASTRRIMAAPYDASSRPRLFSSGSSRLEDDPGLISNALVPSPGLSRIAESLAHDPWLSASNTESNYRMRSGRTLGDRDTLSILRDELTPNIPDYSGDSFHNDLHPFHSLHQQTAGNVAAAPYNQNFHGSFPTDGPMDSIPDYRQNHLAPYLDRVEADPEPAVRGGTFITAQNVHHNYGNREIGLNILHRAVALEALHDSNDSFPQPKCHPETREEMLGDLWKYATDPEPPEQILWLYGPAGTGKSAIMQSLCQRLQDAGRLGGTFFFKRGHPTRGNARALFSTIAYRLALRIPELKDAIWRQWKKIHHLWLQHQRFNFSDLFSSLASCLQIMSHQLSSLTGWTSAMGITCSGRYYESFTTTFHHIGLRRLEAHIREIALGAYQALNVEQSFDDVRKYLTDNFARIHEDHPSTMAKIPRPWPSDEEMDSLVYKSSGHFIYASTIIKFIDDPNFRPSQRLTVVLSSSVELELDSPFAALDQLYTQILNSVPRNTHLLDILRVIANFQASFSFHQIDQLLDLESGDTALALRGLHSLLRYKTMDEYGWGDIAWQHASFGDFLRDPTRAGKFYTGGLAPCMDLARSVLKALSYKNDDKQMNNVRWHKPMAHVAWRISWDWIHYFVSSIPPTPKLLPQIRLINPAFLFPQLWYRPEIGDIIGWFQLWDDYMFLEKLDSRGRLPFRRNPNLDPVLSIAECEKVLLKSPQLLPIFYANFILHPKSSPSIWCLKVFLDMSWDEIRSIICPIQDLVGLDGDKICFLTNFILEKADHYEWTREHNKMARRCIQVLKGVDSGALSVNLWDITDPCWGLVIRLTAPCPDLLQEISDLVFPFWLCDQWPEIFSVIDIHNIVQWLKEFPEPQWGVIYRWEYYFTKVYEYNKKRPRILRFKQEIEDQNQTYSFNDSFDCVPHLAGISRE
ncbi:hypothetical protein B0H14DRAFT_3162138 [Mycena olivaceomarginata]|nr:hypothetical protein B0H14DRAFT_3162138 [Mycena olivaceomarginata]